MELLPPKLRVLPSFIQLDSAVDQAELWEIDSPSLEWSLGLAFLLSTVHNKNFAKSLWKLLRTKNRPKTDHWVPKTKRSVSKYNPFKNRHAIYWDRILILTLQCIKNKLHSALKGLEITSSRVMKIAAELFECVILLYDVDLTGKCQLPSVFSSTELIKDYALKISIFQHTGKTATSAIEKFGFGLSLEFSQRLRHSALVNCLKIARLSGEEVFKVQQAKFTDTNLLSRIFEAGCSEIIPSIYKSPFVISRISEAGFDIDPCTLDRSGFSSFYHCMGRSENDWLMIFYDFATNRSRSIESSVRNPDSDILFALEKVGNLIKNDRLMSKYFLLLGFSQNVALKRCRMIMFFNEYQLDICKQIYLHKVHDIGIERNKKIMISILDTYSKYFYFDRLDDIQNEIRFFKHFVEFSDFYEWLDHFTCLLFFDNFTGLIPLINENNSQIYSDAISSLFLAVLSNKLHPKHTQENAKKCAQRLIPFHYRRIFLKNSEALLVELKTSSNVQQNSPKKILDVLKNSLANFPEIVDEFIINRLRIYLVAVKDLRLKDFPVKSSLALERAIQVVGETLQNEPECESRVKFLLESCISSELYKKFLNMRNDSLSHFRANVVNGRVNVECNRGELLKNVQKELNDVDITFQPVYASQILRVEEFMINAVEIESQNFNDGVLQKMSNQLCIFSLLRGVLFQRQEDNFRNLTCNIFYRLYEYLDKGTFSLSKSIKEFESLIFLLNFIGNNVVTGSDTLKLSVSKLNQTIKEVKGKEITEDIKNEIKKSMSCNESALENIFKDFQTELHFKFTFPYIISLNDNFKDFDIFSVKENKYIVDRVLEYIINSADVMRLLKCQLENGMVSEDVKNKLEEMIMPEKTRRLLRDHFNSNNENALQLLKHVKEANKTKLCIDDVPQWLPLKEREELVNMLLKINFPKPLKRKVISILNNKLWFLINRIDKLKTILIFEDDDISFLWRSRKWQLDTTIEKYMKFLMVQRFVSEKDLRASLEMLLFDCLNILEKPNDLGNKLRDLWEKNNDLFKAANIIDVLGHGNAILQTVGTLLNPEDLPSEFIGSVVELMKDGDSLRALSEFWEKTKLCKKEIFLEALRSKEDDAFSLLRKKIKRCGERAKEYAVLLPLRQ